MVNRIVVGEKMRALLRVSLRGRIFLYAVVIGREMTGCFVSRARVRPCYLLLMVRLPTRIHGSLARSRQVFLSAWTRKDDIYATLRFTKSFGGQHYH